MLKNSIQSIVVILGILIFLSFLALIYGMYSKISPSSSNQSLSSIKFSAKLSQNENIKNIQVLEKDKLLILIEDNVKIRAIIYDVSNNLIIREIVR